MTGNRDITGPNARRNTTPLLVLILLMVSLFAAAPASAQICATAGKDGSPGTITGIVNTYYPGAANAAVNATTITLGAATGASTPIASGDLLLVIQIQDAAIASNNNSRYGDNVNNGPGSGYTTVNSTGLYEFVKATGAVPVTGGSLTLQGGSGSGGLINAYTNAAYSGTQGQRKFQVVRVPQYVSVTLSSGLTALAWNGSTGGILAIDVADTITLNNSIVSVAGLGFRGGAGLQLQGAGGANDDYRNTAPTSATTTTGFHGSKGEGIAGTPRYVWNAAGTTIIDTAVEGYPNGSMARGAPGNAGGGGTDGDPNTANPGGNDENSGGGGGGNGGAGGVGGNTWNSNSAVGGFGGVAFAQSAAGRVVMGGGGGAGSRNNDTGDISASGGAAGGGIVIIRAGTILGTGTINASGSSAYNNTLNDGGGGGGAGGTIIVYSVSGTLAGLTVNASGGRGGDAWRTEAPNGTPGARHGPGGGGGGGVIFLSKVALLTSVAGGNHGITTTANDAYGSTNGTAGPTVVTNMTATGMPGVQPGALCPFTPTEVDLVSFDAMRSEDGVVLEWRTGYEVDNIGFNIYREDQTGKMARLTPHLVAGSALMVRGRTPLTAGLAYSWQDAEVKQGESARYWLEDLDVSGQSTWHGPYFIDENKQPVRRQSLSDKHKSPTINLLNAEQMEAQELANEIGDGSAYQPVGPVERKAKKGKLSIEAVGQQTDVAAGPAVKISVRREGWYRVSQQQLLAAGLSPSVDARKLQMFVDGQEVAITVQGDRDGKLDAGDSVEFYGLPLDTQSTDTRVYWLVAGSQQGLRINEMGAGIGSKPADSFSYTVQRKDRLYYFSNIRNGETDNLFGAFIYYQPTDQTLNVAHLAPAANATLEIALQGFNEGLHQIAVSVNGAMVGTLSFNGQTHSVSELTFPQALLVEGSNKVSLISQAGNSDFSFVDYIRLTYSHGYVADGNSLKFEAPAGRRVTLSGFSGPNIRVVDVTDPKTCVGLSAKVSQETQGYSITFATPIAVGNRTILAFLDSDAKPAAKVAANKISTWRQPANSADFVIIGYGAFSSSLESLKALRNSQGLQTVFVDIEDVYDEFSFGAKSPQALKDFLAYARANWTKAPRYVLLGGTASFDPRNYLGLGETDMVPTKFVETDKIETASDDGLADFNGDGIPEMAVGRLPARTVEEAARMVRKIMSYDQVPARGVGALLIADAYDGYDFESTSELLRPLVPAGTPLQEIRRGSDPDAKQHLMEALNAGMKVVNYAGHGSVDLWKANLLTSQDAAALTNEQKLSLVVAMTCLNGYFIDERLESLAHALMNAEKGGAVAVWSSSGLTFARAQAVANQELFRQLFAGASVRLGDATLKAKSAVTDLDVRRTWILIGDPTMIFKR